MIWGYPAPNGNRHGNLDRPSMATFFWRLTVTVTPQLPGAHCGAPSYKLIPHQVVIWLWVKTLVPLVNPKIAGKWMFIPLKMVSIGIDPYPYVIIV